MTTAFVLSGGGSLGAVQVGMLKALAAHGIAPDLLVGTSAGALNSAWVASHGMSPGSLEELTSVWSRLRRRDVFPIDARQALRGVLGQSTAIANNSKLRQLIGNYAPIDRLEDAAIPAHLVAADLLTGASVLLSRGSLVDAALASAALPGVFPPVEWEGSYLVDGGVARDAGVSQALELGASTVYVLPAGAACALSRPPRSAIGVALHALSLLIQQRLEHEIATLAHSARIKVLPPLCPLSVSAADFGHASELIDRSERAAQDWLDSGSIDLPSPARFLALHRHADIENSLQS